MNRADLYAHPDWQTATFEGAEMSTLLIGLRTTFREKLEWLEEAETLSIRLQEARRKGAEMQQTKS